MNSKDFAWGIDSRNMKCEDYEYFRKYAFIFDGWHFEIFKKMKIRNYWIYDEFRKEVTENIIKISLPN